MAEGHKRQPKNFLSTPHSAIVKFDGSSKTLHIPGHSHFVTFSTYKRRKYLGSDRTRDIVLEVLQKALVAHHAFCEGFVVMPDHVHAILYGDENFNISRFVQVWKKTTSYRIRRFFEKEFPIYSENFSKNDPIWSEGFHDFNLESDSKTNKKIEYMHTNPVTAGLVTTALDWNWSSVRFYELGEQIGVTLAPKL